MASKRDNEFSISVLNHKFSETYGCITAAIYFLPFVWVHIYFRIRFVSLETLLISIDFYYSAIKPLSTGNCLLNITYPQLYICSFHAWSHHVKSDLLGEPESWFNRIKGFTGFITFLYISNRLKTIKVSCQPENLQSDLNLFLLNYL